MALIVIITSLVLERFFGHLQHLRRLEWFSDYRGWLFGWAPERLQQGLAGVFLVLTPIVLAMLLIQCLFQDVAWGFFELVLGVVVVTYCLGPEALNERIDAYLQAYEARDFDKARQIARTLVGDSVPEDVHQQSKKVTTAILYEGNIRIFAVLFWYILLGPVGALLYRTAAYLVQDSRSVDNPGFANAAENVHGLLDWLPARLLSLTFFLTGSFDDAMQGWRRVSQTEQEIAQSNRSIVISTGCGAMRHEVEDDAALHAEGQSEDYDVQWVRTARALVIRSVVVWLAAVALMTMAGWFV